MIFNLFFSIYALAKISAVATTPDISWLIKQIGGDFVEVQTLAKSGENYHFIEARPDFALKLARADLFCQIGAEMEIGWAPKLLEKAANPKILPGGKGSCDLSQKVDLLEKPVRPVDRTMGDSHASGNPHYWLSPLEMKKASELIFQRLSELEPSQKDQFEKNWKTTVHSLEKTALEVKEMLKPLNGNSFTQYHKEFTYFANAYDLKIVASIEEVPGVSPSAARIAQAAKDAKTQNLSLVFAAPNNPRAILQKFSELSGVKAVTLPTSLEGLDSLAYDRWQRTLAQKILQP